MKNFGIIVLLMGIGFFGVENAWAAKEGAKEGTVTVECVKVYPNRKDERPIQVPQPISQADQQCNSEIPDCGGFCKTQSITSETLKSQSSKKETNLKQKNN